MKIQLIKNKGWQEHRGRWGICLVMLVILLSGCRMEVNDEVVISTPTKTQDKLLILCEGLWGMDNSCISYLDQGTLVNKWYQKQNPKHRLGDTGNDIIQVNDTLIAISVNWSNIIQYIYPDGRAIAATEDIPNNRKLATDGDYLYCTSYANHGYVAKVDVRTKEIVDTCHVGYEPEGIAYYKGRLFVANTGGYSFQEGHEYESTISVIDTQTMKELKRIDTGCINLFGKMSQCGQFICINSCGDYYDVEPKSVVLNMESEEFKIFDFPATYNCTYDGKFYTIGSAFSYNTGEYQYSIHTISLPSMQVEEGLAEYAGAEEVIRQMQSPYGIYISPFSGHLYVSDARSYATNAYVYEFDRQGKLLNRYYLDGLNPAHFLALP